jgi:hypothetical protein
MFSRMNQRTSCHKALQQSSTSVFLPLISYQRFERLKRDCTCERRNVICITRVGTGPTYCPLSTRPSWHMRLQARNRSNVFLKASSSDPVILELTRIYKNSGVQALKEDMHHASVHTKFMDRHGGPECHDWWHLATPHLASAPGPGLYTAYCQCTFQGQASRRSDAVQTCNIRTVLLVASGAKSRSVCVTFPGRVRL